MGVRSLTWGFLLLTTQPEIFYHQRGKIEYEMHWWIGSWEPYTMHNRYFLSKIMLKPTCIKVCLQCMRSAAPVDSWNMQPGYPTTAARPSQRSILPRPWGNIRKLFNRLTDLGKRFIDLWKSVEKPFLIKGWSFLISHHFLACMSPSVARQGLETAFRTVILRWSGPWRWSPGKKNVEGVDFGKGFPMFSSCSSGGFVWFVDGFWMMLMMCFCWLWRCFM